MPLRCFFHRRVVFLLAILLFSAGIQTALCQDTAATWVDTSTGLMWTVEDSGTDMNWSQANSYCEGLTTGGHDDWRLATREELEGLYDRSLKKQYKAKGPINLQSANVWSGSKNNLGDSWLLNFGYGGSSISSGGGGGCSTLARALCTRPAEKK